MKVDPVTTATEASSLARSVANNVAEPAVGAPAVAADVSRWQSGRADRHAHGLTSAATARTGPGSHEEPMRQMNNARGLDSGTGAGD